MGSFKRLRPDFIGSKYEGGVKVILESEEDVRIFSEHWFPHYQDKVSFQSAEDGQRGGGGCGVVRQKVKEARQQKLTAYGIVDRDALLSDGKHELFWEPDDEKFHRACPYGEEIYVLRRWEIENYFLKPKAFSAEMARRASRAPTPAISSENLLGLVDDFIAVTALTTFMVGQGQKSPKPGFGCGRSGQQLREDIGKHLGDVLAGANYDSLAGDIVKIRAFSGDEESSEKRWERMSRILDGKKALSRICGYLSSKHGIKGIGIWEEMRGCLADRIASEKLIDEELTEVVNRFSAAACKVCE
jgi:hypothetical protein